MSSALLMPGLAGPIDAALMGPDEHRLRVDPPAHAPSPAPSTAPDQRLDLRVTLTPLARDDAAARARLAQEWPALHQRAQGSAFLSWDWMAAWLAMLPAGLPVHLLRAEDTHGRACGLALLVPQRRRRFGLPVCTTWHLHATGNAALDALTIEHNDFLVDRDGADALRAAMLAHWLDATSGARELSLPGVAEGLLTEGHPALDRRERLRTSWHVDLDAVRQHEGGYLRLIGANVRQQIRRSIKGYETLGKLRLELADSVEQALDWLDRLAELHQVRWTAKGHPGAFADPAFVAFHRRLITSSWASGRAMLLAVRAGDHEVGYLYSLAAHGLVCFYQGGFDYTGGSSARPGYVAHALAVALHARQGHARYDFLMGEARYKRSMSTGTEQLAWRVLATRDWPLRLEAGLQALRQRLRRPSRRSKRAPHAD